MPALPSTCQAQFERNWGRLMQPHVRALAWLLDAPDLLDATARCWQGKIATLAALPDAEIDWLFALDRDPSRLDAALGERIHTRLGLYAEKLMAFYFREHGRLVEHGLQVRANRNDTVGEFDFLLDAGDTLEHLEFATKFYLLEGEPARDGLDSLVGPNLADSLGAKMRKIVDRQLVLGAHPAAQAILPRPVGSARALVKGWLYWPAGRALRIEGISERHCRGFWCAVDELDGLGNALGGTQDGQQWVVLPRMQWLAPFKSAALEHALSLEALQATLAAHFALSAMPVLIGAVQRQDGMLVEQRRGFVVPANWRARAAQKRQAPAS